MAYNHNNSTIAFRHASMVRLPLAGNGPVVTVHRHGLCQYKNANGTLCDYRAAYRCLGKDACGHHKKSALAPIICTICQEAGTIDDDGTVHEKVEVHCGHVFHHSCLARLDQPICPNCRDPFFEPECFNLFQDTVIRPISRQLYSNIQPTLTSETRSRLQDLLVMASGYGQDDKWKLQMAREQLVVYSNLVRAADHASDQSQYLPSSYVSESFSMISAITDHLTQQHNLWKMERFSEVVTVLSDFMKAADRACNRSGIKPELFVDQLMEVICNMSDHIESHGVFSGLSMSGVGDHFNVISSPPMASSSHQHGSGSGGLQFHAVDTVIPQLVPVHLSQQHQQQGITPVRDTEYYIQQAYDEDQAQLMSGHEAGEIVYGSNGIGVYHDASPSSSVVGMLMSSSGSGSSTHSDNQVVPVITPSRQSIIYHPYMGTPLGERFVSAGYQ